MIYTMGNRNLAPLITAEPEGEYSWKNEGGAVWDTPVGVQEFITQRGTGEFLTVYGVDADWVADTRPMDGPVTYRALNRAALLVVVDETGADLEPVE